jgi:hypothetical protein
VVFEDQICGWPWRWPTPRGPLSPANAEAIDSVPGNFDAVDHSVVRCRNRDQSALCEPSPNAFCILSNTISGLMT